MEKALELLRDNFAYLLELLRERIGETGVKADTPEETSEEVEEEIPIEDLDLSVRAINCLKRAKINTLRELLDVVRNRPEDLKKIKNLGQKTYEEILEKVQQRFLSSGNTEKRGVGE
jgi:DNA-directed RNA polymerase subunit alpha